MNNNLIYGFLEKLNRLKDFDSELYIASGRSQGISFDGMELENSEYALSEGMGLRVFKGGKTAFSHSNNVNNESLDVLLGKIRAILDVVKPDKYRKLPLIECSNKNSLKQSDIFDENLFATDVLCRQEMLKEYVAKSLKADYRIKRVLRTSLSQSEAEINLINSRGSHLCEKFSSCGYGMSCVAQQDGDTQISSVSMSKRFYEDLDFNGISSDSVWMACALLGGRRVDSGRRQVLLHPHVAVEFLELVASAVSADNLQKNKSFLIGMSGNKTASSTLNIIDDGRMPKGMATSSFDDEGTPTGRIDVIRNGVLENILYDCYTAERDNVHSTGNAGRPSFKSVPSPGASNFYIAPGKRSKEDIITGVKKGIYVLEVMGMHMADPVSGDFSIGVSGISIENGRLAHSVGSVTMAGNMKDFLLNISEIGNDIIFYGSYGSPVVLVDGIMIGG